MSTTSENRTLKRPPWNASMLHDDEADLTGWQWVPRIILGILLAPSVVAPLALLLPPERTSLPHGYAFDPGRGIEGSATGLPVKTTSY